MRLALICLMLAGAAFALGVDETYPDPMAWSLSGEALRAIHASTLEELLRESPLLRVESFGGAALPLRASAGPWPRDEILIVLDGVPYRDPWTGESQIPHLPLSLIDKLEFSRRPDLLEFGAPGAAGVLRVTTHRHQGRRARAYFHVNPLMIGEPWTERFSVETPPGGVSLAIGLDGYHRDLTLFSERSETAEVLPEVNAGHRRTLLTRLSLDAGAAGPLDFQLIQSNASLAMTGGNSSFRSEGLYRLSLAAPETPVGEFLLTQNSVEKSSEMSKAGWIGFGLRWSKRGNFFGLEGLSAHAGYEWIDPEWERNAQPGDPGDVGSGFAALAWNGPLAMGYRVAAGGRVEGESGRDAKLNYQLGLSRIFQTRPFRLELFAAGGQEREAWARDRFPSEALWPNLVTTPNASTARDFQRMGASLGAFTRDWSWSLGYLKHAAGEGWSMSPSAAWSTESFAAGSSMTFSGRARLKPLARIVDWSMDTLFTILGGGRSRPAGTFDGTFVFEQAFGDDVEATMLYPNRIRLGMDYLRTIAEGDGHWRIASPLEFRRGPNAETLMRWDLRIELRVLDGRLWMQLRDLLDRGGEEIAGYPMPGREYMVGVDWALFN